MDRIEFSTQTVGYDDFVRKCGDSAVEKRPEKDFVLVSGAEIVFLTPDGFGGDEIVFDANVRFEKCEVVFGTLV